MKSHYINGNASAFSLDNHVFSAFSYTSSHFFVQNRVIVTAHTANLTIFYSENSVRPTVLSCILTVYNFSVLVFNAILFEIQIITWSAQQFFSLVIISFFIIITTLWIIVPHIIRQIWHRFK